MSTNLDLEPKRPTDAQNASHANAIDIRYGQIGVLQLRIRTTDTGAILDELTGRIATAPNFFQRTAVSIDLSELPETPDVGAIKAVIDATRRAGMLTVGVAGSRPRVDLVAASLNLPVLSSFRSADYPAAAGSKTATDSASAAAAVTPAATVTPTVDATPTSASATLAASGLIASSGAASGATTGNAVASVPSPSAAVPVTAASLIHAQTVRSGQRVYARNRDLIITASVGAGAEVMADGCLHVYGSLRGRAMAGVHGQLSARIYCQEFNAELVSIAGVFRVFETIPAELAGKPVQAWLDGENLKFAPIGG